MDENKVDFEQLVKEKDKKIDKLLRICYAYSEQVYMFFSNFAKDNLTEDQFIDLMNLKQKVDSYISDNADYKKYLEHKYIIKDLTVYENIEDIINYADMNFSTDASSYIDDTEPLVLKEDK